MERINPNQEIILVCQSLIPSPLAGEGKGEGRSRRHSPHLFSPPPPEWIDAAGGGRWIMTNYNKDFRIKVYLIMRTICRRLLVLLSYAFILTPLCPSAQPLENVT